MASSLKNEEVNHPLGMGSAARSCVILSTRALLLLVNDEKRVLDTNRPSCPVGVYDAIAWSQKSGLRCGLHDKSQGLHRRQYPQIFSNPPASIPS